jgi:hypothetical protein
VGVGLGQNAEFGLVLELKQKMVSPQNRETPMIRCTQNALPHDHSIFHTDKETAIQHTHPTFIPGEQPAAEDSHCEASGKGWFKRATTGCTRIRIRTRTSRQGESDFSCR